MDNNLRDILHYQRGHLSTSELWFIKDYLEPRLEEFADYWFQDTGGNYLAVVNRNGTKNSKVLFAAHLDTCHRNSGFQEIQAKVLPSGSVHLSLADHCVYHKDTNPNGSTCLGADDGVGIFINLELMKAGVAGTYMFTRGEEQGLIGAEHAKANMSHFLGDFKLCIEVDRQDFSEIITEQASGKCASEDFAKELAAKIGMGHEPSPWGVYTDNSCFNGLIEENVNIAAGYWSQHTINETVDETYVNDLASAMKEVDWDALTVVRDTTDLGDDPWGSAAYGGYSGYYSNGGYGRRSTTNVDGSPYKEYGVSNKVEYVDNRSSYEEYRQWTKDNATEIAWYLYVNGIDSFEINREFATIDEPDSFDNDKPF